MLGLLHGHYLACLMSHAIEVDGDWRVGDILSFTEGSLSGAWASCPVHALPIPKEQEGGGAYRIKAEIRIVPEELLIVCNPLLYMGTVAIVTPSSDDGSQVIWKRSHPTTDQPGAPTQASCCINVAKPPCQPPTHRGAHRPEPRGLVQA